MDSGNRLTSDRDYYVYTYAYPPEMGGKVFYVGKGYGERIHIHRREAKHGAVSEKHDVIRSIWRAGYDVVRTIVFETDNEVEAFQHEQRLIASIGLENLVNKVVNREFLSSPTALYWKPSLRNLSVYKAFMKKIYQAEREDRVAHNKKIVDEYIRGKKEKQDVIELLTKNAKFIL